mmetsp:Transcript_7634/g.19097  ORF Transcript_7634/g.19097 Transcript_7634/m.19097 type:complete len:257 (-) Transcript_7634:347-1117(-)
MGLPSTMQYWSVPFPIMISVHELHRKHFSWYLDEPTCTAFLSLTFWPHPSQSLGPAQREPHCCAGAFSATEWRLAVVWTATFFIIWGGSETSAKLHSALGDDISFLFPMDLSLSALVIVATGGGASAAPESSALASDAWPTTVRAALSSACCDLVSFWTSPGGHSSRAEMMERLPFSMKGSLRPIISRSTRDARGISLHSSLGTSDLMSTAMASSCPRMNWLTWPLSSLLTGSLAGSPISSLVSGSTAMSLMLSSS